MQIVFRAFPLKKDFTNCITLHSRLKILLVFQIIQTTYTMHESGLICIETLVFLYFNKNVVDYEKNLQDSFARKTAAEAENTLTSKVLGQ